MILYAYFHSVMTYGLLWGNFSQHGRFYITKENYQNYDGSQKQRFLQRIFKILGILPLTAQYICTITVFVVNNTYVDSTSWKILNYMTLKLETTRTYFSHNLIYLSIKGVLIMMVSRYIIIFLFK